MAACRVLGALTGLMLTATVAGRPLVRDIKDAKEFKKLIDHHSSTTGLPVVVDFYSDSCGPCRMMAPVFKAVAKEYKDSAVFAKVNTEWNRQLQSQYQVRSIPTFMFFADGKKKQEFAGAGEQQLRAATRDVVREAGRLNARLLPESLAAFYARHDATKGEHHAQELHDKCAKLAKSRSCEGAAALDLVAKLKKKYGEKPQMGKRFGPEASSAPTPSSAKSTPPSSFSSGRGGSPRDSQPPPAATSSSRGGKVDLAGVSLEALEAEVAARREAHGDNEEEDEEDEEEEDEEEEGLPLYFPRDFPERVAVIGGGPAGLSAAIYAARAGLRPVVIAPPFGGQLMGKGVDVENFPGLLDQTGPQVVNLMQKQAADFGTRFEEQFVHSVDLKSRPFRIVTNTSTILSHSIVIATGANSRWLSKPGEHDLRGAGVSACATCDGFLFRDRPVVVVGGGDTAMEDALVLARTSASVTVIHRRDSFRASRALAQRVLNHERINVLWNSTVAEFKSSGAGGEDDHERLSHVVVESVETGERKTLECAGAFVAIGHDPNTHLFSGQLQMHQNGYLATFNASTATNVEGVFAAGDVADSVYRQAITSAGSGAMAALDAERYLSASGFGDEEEQLGATLLAELFEDIASQPQEEQYNGYDEAGNVAGRRESVYDPVAEKSREEDLLQWASSTAGSSGSPHAEL
mmetsp:Transcript_5208/g.15301  ORF Transcript_5208/g.15301 Transcript_5208/m.15301 type:complete len:691 (-) Transcript_5208:70-2142(-)